jgi:hypothetical protein
MSIALRWMSLSSTVGRRRFGALAFDAYLPALPVLSSVEGSRVEGRFVIWSLGFPKVRMNGGAEAFVLF